MPPQDVVPAQPEPWSGSDRELPYLDIVKSLAHCIDPGLYKRYFEDHSQAEQHSKACMIPKGRLAWLDEDRWNPESSSQVRRELLEPSGEAQHHPCLLLVSGIGADWMHKLGMTVNLDPRFVAQHIGSIDTYVGEALS